MGGGDRENSVAHGRYSWFLDTRIIVAEEEGYQVHDRSFEATHDLSGRY